MANLLPHTRVPMRGKAHYPRGQPPEGVDVLWRCDARSYSYVIDADREEYGSTPPRIELEWAEIERRTPKGAYLKHEYRDGFTWRRYVPLFARNRRFASTPAEALADFIGRRKRQHYILNRQLRRCDYELELAQSIELKGDDA